MRKNQIHIKFRKLFQLAFKKAYSAALSENIKRGLAMKKLKLLHKSVGCNVKKCKA